MLQTKKVFSAISLCVLGLVTSLLLIYPGIGMPEGEYHDIISGVLTVEPCERQIMPPETKYVSLPYREERFQDGLKCYRFETMLPSFTFQEKAGLETKFSVLNAAAEKLFAQTKSKSVRGEYSKHFCL